MKERETFRRLLRDAADPGLDPGAGARIADGAWARAAEIRAEAARTASARPVRVRRLGWATAAAAGLLAAAALSIRAATPAFAVEGDPVQVLDEDHWDDARRIPAGSWVYVPAGTRTIHARDGSRIEPRPGAVFRVVADARPAQWRVEIRQGDAEIEGGAFVLEVCDRMEVARADAATLRLLVTLGESLDRPPARVGPIAPGAAPVVQVLRGTARVANLRDAQFLMLRSNESAASVVIDASAAARPQIVRQVAWSPQIVLDVENGANLLNALPRGDGSLFVNVGSPGGNVWSVSVPPGQGEAALGQFLLARTANFLAAAPAAPPATAVAGWRQVESVRDGARTRVTLREDGAVVVERGGETRVYASAEDLARDDPEAALLLGAGR